MLRLYCLSTEIWGLSYVICIIVMLMSMPRPCGIAPPIPRSPVMPHFFQKPSHFLGLFGLAYWHIDNDIAKPRVTAILIAHHREARECLRLSILKQHPPFVQFYRATGSQEERVTASTPRRCDAVENFGSTRRAQLTLPHQCFLMFEDFVWKVCFDFLSQLADTFFVEVLILPHVM